MVLVYSRTDWQANAFPLQAEPVLNGVIKARAVESAHLCDLKAN